MIITLIGYRGTGKSTLAAPLAARLGWDWIDADVELERRAGCSIRNIFDAEGEAAFRQLERDTLVDLLRRDRLVLAAGGGAILNPDTRRDFRTAGPVIWLKAAVETIERRLADDASTAARRPGLTALPARAEIETLLARREPLYRDTATFSIDTDTLSPRTGQPVSTAELVELVLSQLPGELRAAAATGPDPAATAATPPGERS